MNNIYIYDGTFSSLLALIEELNNLNIIPDDIKSEEEYNCGILDETIYLKINNKEEKVEHLRKRITKNIFVNMYYVYLSNNNNKEMIIYDFYKLGVKYQNNIFGYRYYDSVNETIKISKYVLHEAHKLKGFLRFKEMKNGFLYAKYSSTNNVLGILANHFKKRFRNDFWIINDEERCNYAIYDKKKVIYITEKEIVSLNLDINNKENEIEDLWKTFFKTVAIKERTNKRCQMNFMPKKYWNNIIEMED